MEAKAYSYTLKTKEGHWLGQVVITDDGFFGAVTDWGNASYAWRSFGDNFKVFLTQLNADYFSEKISMELRLIMGHNKKIDAASKRFTDHILPALQEELKKELKI
jgi:hypothetical protein